MAIRETLLSLGFERHVRPARDAVWLIPPVCSVQAGPFIMGSDCEKDSQARSNECPQHVVSLPTFEIAIYPVTVAEYALALSARAFGVEQPDNWEEKSQFPSHPVSGLTWYDALAYAHWLTDMTGEHWRLPTEAEWEKAARGQDGRIYPWGDTWDPENVSIWEEATTPADRATQPFGAPMPIDAHPLGASPYGVL